MHIKTCSSFSQSGTANNIPKVINLVFQLNGTQNYLQKKLIYKKGRVNIIMGKKKPKRKLKTFPRKPGTRACEVP